ncbi:MAG: hypothetical protein B0W54_18455 [Cellvibrio sp. 79]|nr:MAG: hypothetical protein B0W54_18455 [Cellvibrio sp. 79]
MSLKQYTVRRGDTLSGISLAFDVSLIELLKENPQISNPNLIRSGEQILVPTNEPHPSVHATIANNNFPINDVPLWLKIAYREEGVTEVGGSEHNPRILEYHASTRLNKIKAAKDETAWCSSFVNWCIEKAGLEGTNSAWALDWDNWGIKLQKPTLGCVVVFSRTGVTNSGGHVGFYIDEGPSTIEVFGGNQRNSVNTSNYPKNGISGSFSYKHLSYLWPKDVELKESA